MSKRVKDMEKGHMYEWLYKGNKCVGHVTFKGNGVVRCHYAVGMWDDSEAEEEAEHDYLAIDVDINNYLVEGIRDATIEQQQRYTSVVKKYQELIEQMNREYPGKKSTWKEAPVPVASPADKCSTVAEALGVAPADTVNPDSSRHPEVTIVDKIDLDNINATMHPHKKTKEEKREEREANEQKRQAELEAWQQKVAAEEAAKQERLESLGAAMKIDRRELCLPGGVSGYKYQDGEVVRFKANDNEGMAVGMVDDLNMVVGYYVAMNIDGDGTVKRHGDTLSDGTTAGSWESSTVISLPNKMERSMGEQFLVAANIDFINEIREQNNKIYEAKLERLRKEEEERKQREEERKQREEAEREAAAAKALCEEEAEDAEKTMFANMELSHVPYCRGTESLLDLKWPVISDSLSEYQMFFGLSELSKIIGSCKVNLKPTESGFRTYILTRPYMHELKERKEVYCQQFTSFLQLLGNDTTRCGAICYRNGNTTNFLSTIIYNVEVHKNGRETIRLALFMDNELQVTYRGSSQGMFGDTTPIICYFCDNSPKNLRRMSEQAKTLVFAFLAMEQDTDQTIRRVVTAGDGAVHRIYERTHLADQPDIELRDSTWYTTIYVNHTITVDSYPSHRWMGSGEDKHLEPVTVSSYTKQGYTRIAKVKSE